MVRDLGKNYRDDESVPQNEDSAELENLAFDLKKEFFERLPDFWEQDLKAALEDTDEPRVLLVALRHLAEAKGGMAKIAKAAGIERESLYRALSARGNPRLSTLTAVTKALGLRLTVETVSTTVS